MVTTGPAGFFRGVTLALILTTASAPGASPDPIGAILEHRSMADNHAPACGRAGQLPPADVVEVDGRPRRLIVVVPDGYDPGVRHPLVVAFHGRTSPAAHIRSYYDLEAHASRPTLFVYPSGLPEDGPRRSWSDPGDPAESLRDYRLFDAIVALMVERYCVDRKRIFVVGHSLGAWFANSLACARGDVLRAIGTVAGGISAATCRGRPAAIVLHHPLDRLVPYERALEVVDVLLDGRHALRADIVVHAGFDCMRFDAGSDPILFCPHSDIRTASGRTYPHQWPPAAGEAIMRFFEALP